MKNNSSKKNKNLNEIIQLIRLRYKKIVGNDPSVEDLSYWVNAYSNGSNKIEVLSKVNLLSEKNALVKYVSNNSYNEDYNGKIKLVNLNNIVAYAGIAINIEVDVINLSKSNWDSVGVNPTNLCYHWYTKENEIVIFDGIRTQLPQVVLIGEVSRCNISVTPPSYSGVFNLRLTMVKEGIAWFEDKGFETPVIEIKVNYPLAKFETEFMNLLQFEFYN